MPFVVFIPVLLICATVSNGIYEFEFVWWSFVRNNIFVRMILLKDPHAIGPDSFKNKYRCLDLWFPVGFSFF